jgi:hypothetical protein
MENFSKPNRFFLCPTTYWFWQEKFYDSFWKVMMRKKAEPTHKDPRPLAERALPDPDLAARKAAKPRRTVTVNLAESPLAWLHTYGHLNERQFLAGEKLRSDYEIAGLGPRITMAWEHMPVSRGKRSAPSAYNPTDRALSAKQRFDGGIAALGRDLSDVAWRVICAGESVPVAEKSMGWPARSGKLVLRIALDRLGDYYRLPG